MQVKQLQNIVGYPTGKKELIKEFQSTNDIINAVLEQHNLNKDAFKKIAKHFDGDDEYTICRKLWEFVHYNMNYKAEPNLQTVKSVSKMLFDAQNGKGNDCKHFSGFIAGCLDALKIPYVYRFAAYQGKIPTHVYVVAKCGDDVICDAVLPYFDSEKPVTYKIDIDPKKKNDMPLIRMSGFDTATIGYTTAQKIEHNAALVAATPARGAFLALVELNVHGLATKLQQAIAKDSRKVESVWYKFGGDFSKLKSIVAKGATRRRILGVSSGMDQNNNTVSPDYQQIGFAIPASVTAFVTAASPIILAFIGVFKQTGVKSDDVSADTKDYSGNPITDTTTTQTTGGGLSTNTMLLIGGAAVVAFFIFKKK